MTINYLDFELEIGTGNGVDFPVTVVHSPAGEASTTMRWPFSQLALEYRLKDVQIALLSSGGKRRQALSSEEQAVQAFGSEIFDAVMTGEVRSRYDVSQERARQQGKGLRLKLHIQAPALAALPWEFLYDARAAEYVCLSRNTPIVRYMELPQTIQPLTITPPLRILGMIASPNDLQTLDIAVEKARVERAISGLQAKGVVALTWLEGQTWRHLQRAMGRGGPWHVFHFIGHGGFDTNRDEGLVALADDQGNANFFSATELGRLLTDHRSLRLVLLNACEGARGSVKDIFSSTAATLVRRGIPAVVAMQYAITDAAAIEFAQTFYENLADAMPVDAAVIEARKAISFAITNSVEWGTPVLYMRSPDGQLFDVTPMEQSTLPLPKVVTPPEAKPIPSNPVRDPPQVAPEKPVVTLQVTQQPESQAQVATTSRAESGSTQKSGQQEVKPAPARHTPSGETTNVKPVTLATPKRQTRLGWLVGASVLLVLMWVLFNLPLFSPSAEPPPSTRTPWPLFTPTPVTAATTIDITTTKALVQAPTAVSAPAPTSTSAVTISVAVAQSTTSAPTPPKAMLSITDEIINVRQGPGTAYDLAGTVNKGQQFDIVGKNQQGDWWQICCVNGQLAWIFGQLADVQNTGAVAVVQNIPTAPPELSTPIPQSTALQTTLAPAEASKPATSGNDFVLVQKHLWDVIENGGTLDGTSVTCGQARELVVNVLNANGNRLNGVAVQVQHGAKEIYVTGSQGKGDGAVEFLLGGSQDVKVIKDTDGREVSSDMATNLTTHPWDIPYETLIGAHFCTDDVSCKTFVDHTGCYGHYSWTVTFQRRN